MTAEERNAQLRQLSHQGSDDGPAPWNGDERDFDAESDLPNRRLTLRVGLFLLALLVVVGGSMAAVWWYATNSYFVGLDDGRVAIFKGRPDGLLFFEPKVVEETDLTEAAVPPARAADVEQGHESSSLADARRYVRNLRRDSDIVTGGTPTTATTATPPTTTAVP